MSNYIKLTIIGHVGRDPKAPSERNPDFVTFPIAVTETWKDKNSGERVSRTDWYECVTSQTSLANIAKNYVKKGNALYIEGSPKLGTYKTKEGEVKAKVEVNISKIILLGDKSESSPSAESLKTKDAAWSNQSHTQTPPHDFELDDDIPF